MITVMNLIMMMTIMVIIFIMMMMVMVLNSQQFLTRIMLSNEEGLETNVVMRTSSATTSECNDFNDSVSLVE